MRHDRLKIAEVFAVSVANLYKIKVLPVIVFTANLEQLRFEITINKIKKVPPILSDVNLIIGVKPVKN